MYSSLDRIDITTAGENGRRWYIQTDHRSADEMAQATELSTVLALLRILNAQRLADSEGAQGEIRYVVSSPPPAFMLRAIAAAGGRSFVDLDVPVAAPADAPALDDLLQSAFAALAQRTAADLGVAISLEGLAAAELALTAEPVDPERDEIGYWGRILRLGALGGEVMRAANGGRWTIGGMGTLPVVLATGFRGEQATVNPLGKVIKLLANGEEDSLVSLVRMIIGQP
ncbi:MAG TPA: hypothetical protein VGE07_26990 [Herpetosiphonaceae bacterium]